MEKANKNKILKTSIFIASIFAIFLSVTYAFVNLTLIGTKKEVITSGNLELELEEDENNLTITDALPMADEVGMIQEPFTFRLVNKTENDTDYVIKLVPINTNNLDPNDVKYGLEKDKMKKIDLVSNIQDGIIDSGKILGNQIINYTLRLWIKEDVTDNSVISGKSLSYRINVNSIQEIEGAPSTIFDTAAKNLGEKCTTYNDGIDTFLVGQCQNNYVWYSGKLWRIVLKNNETGAVKMVTDNAITVIPYRTPGSSIFENSDVDQWLTQEFLPTLNNYKNYLVVDSIWNNTTDNNSTPNRPKETTVVTRTVGLLNSYEYYTTYNNSKGLATTTTTYLNNGVNWFLINPYSSTSIRLVRNNGTLGYEYTVLGFGVRPSINFKSNVQIESGSGTSADPYRLIGNKQEIINGTTLISTRYSGEYITFNNELYRIVGVENGLTKITSIKRPKDITIPQFDTSGITNFANAQIKTNLENYYQNLDSTQKNMIEPNTTWYLGTVGYGVSYKTSICAKVDQDENTKDCQKTEQITTANIALPRVGEMFTSRMKMNENTWTLTPANTSNMRIITSYGYLYQQVPTSGASIHPSMYLKSTIKIASNNTGDGTYDNPYTIE